MAGSVERWRSILNQIEGAEAWSIEDAQVHPRFFHAFRPDGRRLDEVFRGIHRGDEILERLRRVYAVAGHDLGDMYFIVRNPAALSREKALNLGQAHVAAMRELAPTVRLRVEVSQGQAPDHHGRLETDLYDARCDYVRTLEPEKSDALLLEEPLYHLACDYLLAHHLLWPLYRKASGLQDPFGPYFELWTAGAAVRYEDPDLCRVWVSRPA